MIKIVGSIGSTKMYESSIKRACGITSCRQNGLVKNYSPESSNLQTEYTPQKLVTFIGNRLQFLAEKYKRHSKLPKEFDSTTHEETINKCLEKYLEFFPITDDKNIEETKTKIKAEINEYFINEANKVNSILYKNKDTFEELNTSYQNSMREIVKEIRQQHMNSQDALAYIAKKKQPIDKKFAQKILNIFAKEYKLKMHPKIKIKTLKNNAVGGWDPLYGDIKIDSLKFSNFPELIDVLYHEFTHFRQDSDIIIFYGMKEYIKCLVVTLRKIPNIVNDMSVRNFVQSIYNTLTPNPLFQYLNKTQKPFVKQKSLCINLTKLNILEKCNYIKAADSYDEYRNQFTELHAFYNGNYMKNMFKQLFPNFADMKKC